MEENNAQYSKSARFKNGRRRERVMKKNLIINLAYFYIIHIAFYVMTNLKSNFIIDISVLALVILLVMLLQLLPRVLRVIINAIVMVVAYAFTIANIINLTMKNNVIGLSSLRLINELFQVKDIVTEAINPMFYASVLLPIIAIILLVVIGEKETVKLKTRSVVVVTVLIAAIIYGSASYNFQLYKTVANPYAYVKNFGLSSYLIRDLLPFTKLGNPSDYTGAQINGKYQTNEDTGKFANKTNVVFVVAESLDDIAIDREVTPTLYKMSEDGINFENYYTISNNTNASEYSILTSLIPPYDSNNISNYTEKKMTIPNVFSSNGYCTTGIHSNLGTFYDRNTTYPELYGFDTKVMSENMHLKGNGDGLPNDAEMFEKSLSYVEEKNCEKTFTYYMSYSGHAPYARNRFYEEETKSNIESAHPENDNIVSSYMAANVYLDEMMEEMINYYDEKGVLNETLFIVVSDHYPYSITYDGKEFEASEQYKSSVDHYIDYYNVPFFIYDPAQVQEDNLNYGNNTDILPTLSDLMGFVYDDTIIHGTSLFDNEFNHTVRWYGHYGYSVVSKDIKYDDNLNENILGIGVPGEHIDLQEEFATNYFPKYDKKK